MRDTPCIPVVDDQPANRDIFQTRLTVSGYQVILAMRTEMNLLSEAWRKQGHRLDFGVGIAKGYATLGMIGFEGRVDYGAIGPVTNLAARLCEHAQGGQILVSQRVFADVEALVESRSAGNLELKGIHNPVPTYDVLGLKDGG